MKANALANVPTLLNELCRFVCKAVLIFVATAIYATTFNARKFPQKNPADVSSPVTRTDSVTTNI